MSESCKRSGKSANLRNESLKQTREVTCSSAEKATVTSRELVQSLAEQAKTPSEIWIEAISEEKRLEKWVRLEVAQREIDKAIRKQAVHDKQNAIKVAKELTKEIQVLEARLNRIRSLIDDAPEEYAVEYKDWLERLREETKQ
jgi:hypothetical protein